MSTLRKTKQSQTSCVMIEKFYNTLTDWYDYVLPPQIYVLKPNLIILGDGV